MILEGMRVLDFGRYIAGPYCAALLADHGADVIRIERVEGGEDRCIAPIAETGEGGLFLQMNRGKRCLTLNLASAEAREVVRRLVSSADVLVANLPPGTLKQLGLDYATISSINPRMIVATATAFGSSGPLSDRVGFDSVGQAMSGAMFISGSVDGPSRSLVNFVDLGTAQACAFGIAMALLARERTGRGQLIEGSLLRTGLIHSNALLIEQAVARRNRVPQGNRGFTAAPVDTFRCKDGWIIVQTVGQSMFDRWCKLVDRQELLTDPRMLTDESRGDHSAEISAYMALWCSVRSREEALLQLAGAKIPCAPVYTLQETLDDPHIGHAGLLREASFPGISQTYPLAQHPVDFSDAPLGPPRRAPLLGEHTDEILHELGYSADDVAALRRSRCI